MGLSNNLGKLSNMITSTGSAVGIGTSSPSANLQLSGFTSGLPASSGSAQRGGFRIANSSNIAFDFGTVGAGQAWMQVSDVNNYASNFSLLLNPNGGNAGIGTSSITNGTSYGGSGQANVLKLSSANYPCLEINTTLGGGGSLQFTYGSNLPNQVGGYISYNYASGTVNELNIWNQLNGGIVIGTNNSTRMVITNGGQTLIGSTGSLYTNVKLSVKQTAVNIPAEIWSSYSGDEGSAALMLIKFANSSSSSQVFQRFVIDNGNTACGQINGNGASQVAFGSWSDSRLKDNIENLPSQLSNILSLRPVEFDYKNGSGHQIGFVAQEMKEIYPDAVGEDSDGFLTITGWSKTEARLVKAIQEQQQQIEELRQIVATK
jgi:hypothetical protein